MGGLTLTEAPMPIALALIIVLTILRVFRKKSKLSSHVLQETKTAVPVAPPYTSITPLSKLDLENEPPLKLRPFKPTYHLTMALENLEIDELVQVDKTYKSRVQLRRQILAEHPSTSEYRPGSEAAIQELYTWMMTIYLPRRFPTMYSLEKSDCPRYLYNKVTGGEIPLEPSNEREALLQLGSHVDTDFLILLPSPVDGSYHLEAFVSCFPSGFSTLEKLGQTLAAIHKPVPGYEAKLEKSMDRFFAKIPVGRIVKRANWSITTSDVLYAESGNHLYVEEGDADQIVAKQKAEVHIPDCRLRCERQTLHRLPNTKALVFAFKTYQYTLAELKAEGCGEELATAAEGFEKGSVPEMSFYKREVVWGDKVKEYLRS